MFKCETSSSNIILMGLFFSKKKVLSWDEGHSPWVLGWPPFMVDRYPLTNGIIEEETRQTRPTIVLHYYLFFVGFRFNKR